MIIYFIVFTLILLGNFSDLKESKVYYCFLLTTIIIFFCFGYMTGSDWRAYEQLYQNLNNNTFSFYRLQYEPGFLFYISIFKILNIDFWYFLIFSKVICFIAFIHLINKIQPESRYLIMGFFLVSFGLYYFIDNPLRNLLSASIYIIGYKYILNKKFLMYLLFVFIASLFHYSALFTLPFYFIINKDIKRIYWVVVYLSITFISILFKDNLANIFLKIIPLGSLIGGKIDYYFGQSNYVESNFFSFGGLIKFGFFILIIYSKDLILSIEKYGLLLFNGSLIFLVTNRLGAAFEVLSRLQMFSAIFFCITVAVLIKSFHFDSRLFYRIAIVVIIYLTIIVETTTTYKYIPYTNYLTHSYKELSFYERSNYNFINSPYNSD